MTKVQLDGADELFTAYIQVAPFRDPDEGMFPFTYWLNCSYLFGDISSSKIELEVPPNAIVLRVVHQISAVLTDASTMTVGDDTDPDGWIEDALGANTAGLVAFDHDADYAMIGKYYPDGDTIDITFTGVPSAGSGKLFAEVLSYFEDLTDT